MEPKGEQPWNSQLHGVPQQPANMEMPLCETHGAHAAGTAVLGKQAVKKRLSSQASVYAQLSAEVRIWDCLGH